MTAGEGWSDAIHSFFSGRELTDAQLEAAMIEELDVALGNPPRHHSAAGTELLRSGDRVDAIRIVTEGSVRLSLPVDDEMTTFHSRTAGRVIGAMSIPFGSPAFFTVTAQTDIEYIEVTLPELDAALEGNPSLTAHFVSVLLRSMVRRNRRSAELQKLVRELMGRLSTERDRLQVALDELRRTQGRLIESEKLATLGQLAAGIGHELNNPAAAIGRAAAYVRADVDAVARSRPGGDDLAEMLEAGFRQAPQSTAEMRASRRALAAAIDDDGLASRLVRIGITDAAAYERAVGGSDDPDAWLAELESHFRLGSSLRTITSSAERIASLVRSVKAYARPDVRWEDEFDVHEGIEESLLLLGHEMHRVKVERSYGELPTISGAPGELNQVWTNLFSNAIQAMDSQGTLRVETRALDGEAVEIKIIDSGHGIDPDHLEDIFEPSFTTKEGYVEFGLGLGLQIARDVVHRHSGTIAVESEPGRTCFTVILPIGIAPLPGAESTEEAPSE
jgi:signal transduction histidine kinase